MSTTNIDKAAAAGNSLITVAATNDTDIYTTAIVAGSFGINIINNSTQTMLKATTLNSTGNIGVVAESNEYIANYAGTFSGSGTVAGGLSTTVNSIKGTTDAVVMDSTVDAAGSDAADKVITVDSDLQDAAIVSADLSKTAFVPKALVNGRVAAKKTGLVIDSSSTHSILSTVITGAVSGTAAGAGTVNVNTIGGSTTARLLRSAVNQNITATGLTNVAVKAADYANAAGFTGAISGSMYAAVGVASDTNLVNRTIMAQVEGTSDTTKESLSADKLDVQALSLHGISSLDAGAAAAIEGASIGGTISVAKLQSSTTADVKDYTVTANGADITADHSDKTYMVNNGAAIAAIGASFGLSAGVVDQESKTAATVTDSTVTAAPETVNVKAAAAGRLTTGITSLSAGGLAAGVAGTTAVNNMKSTVEAAVIGSTLTAKTIDVEAENTVTATATGGAASLSGLGGAGISIAVNTFDDLVKADVAGSTLQATGDVTVDAKESRDVKQVVVNISGGAVAGGAIVAKSSNDSTVGVTLDSTGTTGTEDKSLTSQNGDIVISADKNNTVKTRAVGGSVGIVSAVGINAQASDSGSAAVQVRGNRYTFSGEAVGFSAVNRPEAVVWAGSASVGMDAFQATVGTATVDAKAIMDIDGDNTFKANDVAFAAQVGEDGKTVADTTVIGVGLGGVYSGAVNKAVASTDTTVDVNIGNENYTDPYGNTGITDLYVKGENYVKQHADVSSLTVGGLLAIGAGKAETTSNNTLAVTAKGGNVGTLTVSAEGTSDSNAHANGDGGIADVSLEAAKAVNTVTNTTKAGLDGNWTIAGDLSLGSVQNTLSNVQAEAVHVGAATVSGAKAEDTITNGSTTASIGDQASISAKKVTVLAKNYITTGQDYDYAVDAKAYGGVAVNDDTTTATIKDNTTSVNIGTNAKIDSSQTQTYEAATIGTLKNNINTTAGGAVDGAVATTSNAVTVDNSVNVGSGAALTNSGTYADGGVTLSAYDTLNLTATADATTPSGLGGYVTALSSNSTTRHNKINLDGKIVSTKDINLYAGATPDGSSSSVTMNLAAAAYNHTVIPVKTKPAISNTISEENQVVVGAGADGQAVRHINVTADSGKTKIRKETSIYVWTKGTTNNDIEYVGNSVGVDTYNQSTDNFVQVDGSLTAGTKHNISIAIEGNKVPDDCFLYGTTNSGSYTFTVSDQQIKNGIKTGDADLANELFGRWQMYSDLIAAYGGKDISGNDLTAYTGYVQAKTQIEETMLKLGLAEQGTDSATGATVIVPIEGYTYNYVELPNITASGGNINVNSTNMKGSGSLTANGAPQVTINNTSTAYLKVNDITIGDQGGEIIFKDTSIGDGGNAKINELNTNKTYAAAYKNIHTDDASGSAAAITISNNYTNGDIHVSANPAKLDASLTDEDKADILADTEMTYTPLSTVAIKGALDNALGEITINNQSGDIIIASDSTDTTALINAKKINLTASGSISQTSLDGIVNIGSTPEDVYAAYAEAQKNNILQDKDVTKVFHDSASTDNPTAVSMDETIAATVTSKIAILNNNGLFYDVFGYRKKSAADTLTAGLSGSYKYIYAQALVDNKDTLDDTERGKAILALANSVLATKTNKITGARIAGGSVYITASDINVNGIIQSGYSKYYADIAADALSDANLSAYQNDASRRAQVQGETMYKVNNGGRAVWQAADGNYAYEVQVYYNPSTGGLVVENIDAQGGKVYLNGRISSTGDGKILALDGGAQIQITNESTAALTMGKVLNNNVAGLISITDANQDKQMLYTRNGTTTISNYSKSLNSSTANQSSTAVTSGTPASYAVKEGLRYNWTEGTDTLTTQYYENIVKQRFWGHKTVLDTTALTDMEATITPVTQKSQGDKPTGTYISTVTGASNDYTIIADNVVNDKVRSPVETSVQTVGPLKRKRTYTYTWNVTTGSSQSYVHSLKADKSIDIGFIGQKDGAITINGAGDVNLNGNILNNSTAATLNVTASGTIAQQAGTTITSNVDTFAASKGIQGINIVSLGTTGSADLVKLSAASTTGDVDVAVSGGFAGNTPLQGNVQLTQLTTGSGTVSLSADGDITQSGSGLTVKGDRIDLVSVNGAIGTVAQAIVLEGGQTANSQDTLSASVNAQADDNIYLTQQSGDMRIGTIISTSGDIGLTASDGSLIDALPTGETVNNVDTHTLIQRWTDAGLIAGTGTYTKKLAQDVTTYADNIKQEFAEYTTLKAYYDSHASELDPEKTGADTTAVKHTTKAYTGLAARFANYKSADEYLAQDSTYAELVAKRDNPTYEWTQDQLLYAIKDSIINKSVGTTDSELKQANVSGCNITLAAENVGIDKPDTETISLVGIMNREADLRKLANAEAADVTWDEKDKVAIIGGKVPLGINATGMLNVSSTGNAYMAGRSDSKENYAALNVGTVTSTTGDIRLLGKAGVYNALTTAGANFTGKDLIVEGGTADIGASDKYVTVDLTGGLEARTDGSIYISSVSKTGDLQLNAVYAGHDVNLAADGSIVMDPAADALAYVNAGTTLTLTADADNDGSGDVGTAATAVRVKANGAVVNAAGNNVYLAGKDTGDLVLGVIDAKNGTAQVASDGSISLGQDGLASSFTAKTSSAMKAAQDVNLSGPVTVGTAASPQRLDLTADKGAITQTDMTDPAKGIQVDVLHAVSNKGQNLQNAGNAFNTYDMEGVTNFTVNGDVKVQTNAAQGLTVALNDSLVMGDVSILNLATGTAAGITLTSGVTTIKDDVGQTLVGGNVTVVADGTLVNNGKITSIGNVTLQSTSADLQNTNIIKAAKSLSLLAKNGINNNATLTGAQDLVNETIDLHSTDGDIINKGTVTSTKGIVSMVADVGKIDNQKTVTSALSVSLKAEKAITNEGTVTAKDGDVAMTSQADSITNSGAVEAVDGSVDLQAEQGVIDNKASVTGSTAVTMAAKTISNAGAVKGTDGSVDLTASTGTITNDSTVTAGTDAAMSAAAGIKNSGAIAAGGQAQLTTAAGNIVNTASVQAAGTDVIMTATTGAIDNEDAVTAKRNVILTAYTDLTNSSDVTATDGYVDLTASTGKLTNSGNVTGHTDVTMQAQADLTNSGSVGAATGQVKLTSAAGKIANSKDVTAATDAVMDAAAGIENTDAVTAGGKVDMTTASKDIVNKAAVTANGTDVLMTAMKGGIDNEAAVTAKRDVILTAATDMKNTGDITAADGAVDLTASTGKLTNSGNVTGHTDVTMQAQADLTNSGTVGAATGQVKLTSATGKIANSKDVTAATDVLMDAAAGIANSSSVTATAGTIDMTNKLGDITNTGDVQAGTALTMTDTNGTIMNEGKVMAGTTAKLQTQTGNIINKGVLSAGSDVAATTDNGKVQMLKDVTAVAGDILLKAVTGRVEVGSADGNAAVTAGGTATLSTDSTTKSDIEIYGDIAGTKGISLTTNVGDIIWHGKGTSAQGAVQAVTTVGNIEHTGDTEAGTNVLQQTQTGSITDNGSISAGHDVTQQTQTGDITDNGNIDAGNDASLQTGSGDIDINGNIRANRNLGIHAGSGAITAAPGTVLTAANGNASVSSGKGDVTLHELQALKDADVDATDGDVKIFRIEGENILIAVRNPEKSMAVTEAVAGSKLTLIGDTLDMGTLAQRDGTSNLLELALNETDDNQPMNHISIGNVVTNNGLHIDRLWTKNADIHVSAPKFYIDKLGIIDVAHLSNNDTATTVWGSAPKRDSSNTSYWYDPQNKSPWMNLYFTGIGHKQFSNGVLLRNDDYYYPEYNRFSGVNISLKRTDRSEHAYQQVDDYYVQGAPAAYYDMYNRYDLIDLDKIAPAPTADIVIEP